MTDKKSKAKLCLLKILSIFLGNFVDIFKKKLSIFSKKFVDILDPTPILIFKTQAGKYKEIIVNKIKIRKN